MTSGAVEKNASQSGPDGGTVESTSADPSELSMGQAAVRSFAPVSAVVSGAGLKSEISPETPQEALAGALERSSAAANDHRSLWEMLQRATPVDALRLLVGCYGLTHDPNWHNRLTGLLNREIAAIDVLMTEQVDAVLHHPRFQQLEASWRGLKFLVNCNEDARELAEQDGGEAQIKIRVLSISKREMADDLEGAIEFDTSKIFRKVYDEEFGMPGGEPFGVLLGDYEFTNHIDDITLLGQMAEVAAAAFAPFVTSAAPELLGLESFADLQQPTSLEPTFQQLPYLKWRALRDREDSRFLGLLLPRTLMRVPYENDGGLRFGFGFSEDASGRDHRGYLWGSSAYAFGSVLIRAFATSGWFADIRGAERDVAGGGLVTALPAHDFGTDRRGVVIKASTEVAIPEEREPELSAAGFITLCHCQDTGNAAYFGNQSVQRPKQYDTPEATANAKISAMLQYIMCASRFAHYLKVNVRDKLGSYRTEGELEQEIGRWLSDYVTPDELASLEIKACKPLREGRVQIRAVAGKPGTYSMVMHLLPHFQLDQLTVALKMVTRLSPAISG